jgi:acyl carrier protein phosphodiesterase
VSGIHATLSGMSSRSPYKSKMEMASEDLKEHYEKFNDEFERFFPDLKSYAEGWIRDS